MGEAATLRQEDKTGLVVAIALHACVVALFVLQPPPPSIPEFEQRMTVSLASEVSLEATAPEIVLESREAIAPVLSDTVTPRVEEAPALEPAPEAPDTPPAPTVTRRSANEAPAPDRERSRPDRTPAPTPSPAVAQPADEAEGSRIGDDFLSGAGSDSNTDETRAPAATFGRAERAALASAITRQLRPHWAPPGGVDAERLRSVVTWRLNPDGSLSGTPRCRNIPSSVTASNRPQAALHCERAIRAVRRAASFNLPELFYNRWKELEWEFNIRL
ncbi:MAG: energy transducer TonB [Pseudomonadota bacterium]